jgi:lactate permease
MSGWRGVLGVWPAVLVSGGSFAAVQFAVSNGHGPWLVDVIAGIVSMLSLTLLMRFWRPASIWRYGDEAPEAALNVATKKPAAAPGMVFSAWMPWVLLTVFVFIWGLPDVKNVLNSVSVSWQVGPRQGTLPDPKITSEA